LIGLASAVLFCEPAFARPADKRLAVLEFRGAKIEGEVLDNFSDEVRGGAVEGLAGRGILVITRENMMVTLKDMGKKDCSEGDCEVETARNIGADFVVAGAVVKIDEAFVVTLKLFDVHSAGVLATDRVEAKSKLEVSRQLREAGRNLVADNIGARAAAAPTSHPVASASVPVGGIHIAADSPGEVTVDGEDKGVLPVEVPDLKPDWYRVRVVLANGTVDERDVEVVAGRVARVFVRSSLAEAAAAARNGAHNGVELGGGVWGDRAAGAGYYGGAALFENFGINPDIDFRAGLRFQYGTIDSGRCFLLGIPVSLRLNFGSVYAMILGMNMGLRWRYHIPDRNGMEPTYKTTYEDAGAFIGPEISLLNFRFGEKRNFELAAVQGYAASVWSSHGVGIFYNTFAFSMLW